MAHSSNDARRIAAHPPKPSAQSHSHDSSGNDAPSHMPNPATPAKAGAYGKSGSRPSPGKRERRAGSTEWFCALAVQVLTIADARERIWLETFLLSVLPPPYTHTPPWALPPP